MPWSTPFDREWPILPTQAGAALKTAHRSDARGCPLQASEQGRKWAIPSKGYFAIRLVRFRAGVFGALVLLSLQTIGVGANNVRTLELDAESQQILAKILGETWQIASLKKCDDFRYRLFGLGITLLQRSSSIAGLKHARVVAHAGLKPRRSTFEVPLGVRTSLTGNSADDECKCTTANCEKVDTGGKGLLAAPVIELRSIAGH